MAKKKPAAPAAPTVRDQAVPDEVVIYRVPIDAVNLDPNNARLHGDRNLAAIKASFGEYGQQKPIVIDGSGKVLAGNGTVLAIRELGWPTVKAVFTDLAGSAAKAYAIADNRTAELAEWNQIELAEQLRSLQSEDFDLAAVGYTDDEVDGILERLAGNLTPEFQPAGLDEQSRIDRKAPINCPECGHEFTPA